MGLLQSDQHQLCSLLYVLLSFLSYLVLIGWWVEIVHVYNNVSGAWCVMCCMMDKFTYLMCIRLWMCCTVVHFYWCDAVLQHKLIYIYCFDMIRCDVILHVHITVLCVCVCVVVNRSCVWYNIVVYCNITCIDSISCMRIVLYGTKLPFLVGEVQYK